MASSQRICVRLASGSVVYEGPRPNSLAELRSEVAASMGLECENEIVFCGGSTILKIEDAGEEITAVRDQVMGLLDEFMQYDWKRLPEHLWPAREHRGLILKAVAKCGYMLMHASAGLRNDREVVLAAAMSNGLALLYASPRLRADREVVLAVVTSNGFALRWASDTLRADRDVVLAAVARRGTALLYASPELRGDRDVVLAAVACNGYALAHASEELKADRGVVLVAVARDGLALEHAVADLRFDRDIVRAAVAKDRRAIRYASPDLRVSCARGWGRKKSKGKCWSDAKNQKPSAPPSLPLLPPPCLCYGTP